MGEALRWIAENWPKVPKVLRSILPVITTAGALGVGFGVGLLAWKSGYIEERLGLMATSKDVEQQTAVITDRVDDTNERTNAIVHAALQQYTDSLTLVRGDVEKTMARPILENIITLKGQVQALMKAQKLTTDALEDQRSTAEATTRELLDRIEARPPDATAEALLKIQQQLNELKEQMPQGKHISKGKF